MPQPLTNQEIINATQGVILNAAQNVEAAIEHSSDNPHHNEPFYLSAEFWVAFSFILVVVSLARPIGKVVHGLLTKRSEDIANRIKEAAQLKTDAQKMLAQYEKQYRLAEQEAQDILTKSEREINIIKKENLAKLEADMAGKERDAKARIASAQEKAIQEITALSAEKTIRLVRKTLQENLDNKQKEKLINKSIDLLANIK